jgi:IS30 family transposase
MTTNAEKLRTTTTELQSTYKSNWRPSLAQRTATPSTMSAAEAAAKINVDKSTIARAIRAGKINASRNEFGDYEITPEELSKYRRRSPQQQRQPDCKSKWEHVDHSTAFTDPRYCAGFVPPPTGCHPALAGCMKSSMMASA